MTFIYDILLNFTDDYYYDFYEWDIKDQLINMKKVPLLRVDKETLNDFINCKVRVNNNILKTIENKSIMLKKYKDRFLYTVILSSGSKSIGVCFDNKGITKYKSSMMLDEEEDANMIALNQELYKIEYKKLMIDKIPLLRCDIEKKEYIEKELKKIYFNKEYEKLKYIYYELYDEIDENYDFIYKKLMNTISDKIQNYNILFERLNQKIN